MWWKLLQKNAQELQSLVSYTDPTATVAPTAILEGPVSIGPNSTICPGAFIQGPVIIGEGCLIGNNVMIRGPLRVGDGTLIGFTAELKNAVIGNGVAIGPQCYVADSVVETGAYLGAMVRTSNQRLDRHTVSSMSDDELLDTGLEKLGAHIGAKASLGIQVIILPGRIVAAGSMFGPHIIIEKNLPAARYMLKQELLKTALP